MASGVRRFGPFRFHPETGELFRNGERVELQNQPARVLDLFTRRAGELVTREELRSTLWGNDTYVDFDRSLNFCVRRIRIALEDSSREPTYLETLPRRGYRFLAPVSLGAVRRRKMPVVTAAAFLLGLFGGAALAEEHGLHRFLVDWLHERVLASGEPCPWASS
jgi:DNA-binding winged helix-turn-helix (wHTH) protein